MRVSDRHYLLADFRRAGVAKRQYRKVLGLYLNDGKVERRVLPHFFGVEGPAVEQSYLYLVGILNDVVVRKDVALFADDEAGPLAAARHLSRLTLTLLGAEELFAEELLKKRISLEGVGHRLLCHHRLNVDVDDRRRTPLDDSHVWVLLIKHRRGGCRRRGRPLR